MVNMSLGNLLFCVILMIVSFIVEISSFQCRYVNLHRMTPLVTLNTRPLSTVSSKDFLGNIPRLEIGLRFLKPHLNLPKSYSDIRFSYPMEWIAKQELNKSRQYFAAPGKLFHESMSKVSSISTSIVKYLKKLVATVMIISSSLSPITPNFKTMAVIGNTAAAIASSIPSVANAGVFKKYTTLSPTQKLATTPLFFVCNSDGNPYLQEDIQAGKPEQKIVVYFLSSEDANDYLNEIGQSNPANVNEFRIMAISMEKVVNKIQTRKQSRKLGRYPMSLVYRIQPSSRQCENAEVVAGNGDVKKGKSAMKGVSIPMFTAKGMAVKRANGETAAPYYFAYEDLLDDWDRVVAEAQTSGDKVPARPVIQVCDFVEVMCLSQGLDADSLSQFFQKQDVPRVKDASKDADSTIQSPAIVPPKREIELLRRYYRNEAGMKGEYQPARIMGMPR